MRCADGLFRQIPVKMQWVIALAWDVICRCQLEAAMLMDLLSGRAQDGRILSNSGVRGSML